MRLLGTRRLTWRRLDVIVQHAADDPTTALWRSLAGEHANLALRAAVSSEHSLRVLAWMKTGDASAKPPKNYPLPMTAPPAETRPRRLSVDVAAKLAALDEKRVRDEAKEA